MSYSRRQLEALGEPLGDSVTRKEGGRIIYGGGGGGGGGGTSTQVSDLPDWAKPYAQKALAGAEAVTFKKDAQGNITGLQPYQQYTGERAAQFTPLQKQAFEGAAGMRVAPQVGAATGFATQAAQQALGAGAEFSPYQAVNQYQDIGAYQPTAFQNRFQAPGAYQTGQFGVERVAGPELEQFQMGPAERVRADRFGGRQAEQYMSPYIEQAMEPQLREARRSSEIQRQADQAMAVQRGAFGGSRQAIVEAERQRNLGTQLGDIRARGLQSAYEQAAQQFNQDAARRMQAQLANQQAGLTTGQQNLAALLGVQQLGAQTGMQAQLANQQQAMEAQRLAEQSRQFGAGQGLSAAQLQAQYGLSADQAAEASRQFAANQAAQQAQARAQYGQAAQQLAEQSRQYGAGLGLQGAQAALQGAGTLGQLGAQQFGQQKDIMGVQQQFGTQQQQQIQNILSQQYQDFLNQQRYPYQQLEFLSSMVRGTPTGQVQTMYQGPGSLTGQLAGLGMGAYGLSQMGRAFGSKEGGLMEGYAEGGSVTSDEAVADILGNLSDQQLAQARQDAMQKQDANRLQLIDEEMAKRASLRQGVGSAFNALPAEDQDRVLAAASGGMVAFADGGNIERYQSQGLVAPPEDMTYADTMGFGVAPEALAMDEYRRTELLRRRQAAEDAERLKFLETAAPETAARMKAAQPAPAPQPKGQQADVRRVDQAVVDAGPKLSRSERSAVNKVATAMAAQAPVDKSSLKSDIENYLRAGKAEDAESLKSITAAIKEMTKLPEYDKNEALAKFGFAMAAAASRPGARFLSSISAAAPEFIAHREAYQKKVDEARKLSGQLGIEQAKLELAMRRDDRKAAADSALKVKQLELQEQKMAQDAAYQKAAIGKQTGIMAVYDELKRANPQGDPEALLRKASEISGYSYRTEASRAKQLQDALTKIDNLSMSIEDLGTKNPAQAFADRKKRLKEEAYRTYGGDLPPTGAPSSTAAPTYRFDAKGNLIQ